MTRAAELIARARRSAGLTQAELGQRAGVAQSVVSAYENGRRRPSVDVLERLVTAAGARLVLTLATQADPARKPLTGPLGQRVRGRRDEILDTVERFGVTNVRVFGSVARAEEDDSSDVDLLVDIPPDVGLFALVGLQRELSTLLGAPVDVVPAADLRARLRDDVLADAVPL